VKPELFRIFGALPLRTASRLSSRTATNLDTPKGAVYTHSCVRSGLADEMADIN
jgi:hypothetical protein